jgi:hypothetical protein
VRDVPSGVRALTRLSATGSVGAVRTRNCSSRRPTTIAPARPTTSAASLVTTGAIDEDAFRTAHGEIVSAFSKVCPFLAEMRSGGASGFCKHMEAVVLAVPDAEALLARTRDALLAAAKARRSGPSSGT